VLRDSSNVAWNLTLGNYEEDYPALHPGSGVTVVGPLNTAVITARCVPEPATVGLMLAGLAGIGTRVRARAQGKLGAPRAEQASRGHTAPCRGARRDVVVDRLRAADRALAQHLAPQFREHLADLAEQVVGVRAVEGVHARADAVRDFVGRGGQLDQGQMVHGVDGRSPACRTHGARIRLRMTRGVRRTPNQEPRFAISRRRPSSRQ
jgi:hypothetical protein